jgi:hypothetical protein
LDAAGNSESQLGLFDNDFAAKLDGLPDKKTLSELFATANVVAHGDNLLLTASQANLPTLELSQHGVVHALPLALPAGTVIYSILPSSDALVHAVVGIIRTLSAPNTTPGAKDGPSDSRRSFAPTEIDEFYPQDGSLVRRVTLESGPLPVCAINGSYTFVVPRGQDGKLQLIHARPVSN